MRVLLLADPGSIHTIRWARSLYERGVETSVFGLGEFEPSDYPPGITVYSARIPAAGWLNKLRYLTVLPQLRSTLRRTQPDIVHAHYASSYGLLGRLSGFKPFVVSLWGSDVYEFPTLSPLHRRIFRNNLASAQKVLSTSHIMADQARRYAPSHEIEITPFGVDLDIFTPAANQRPKNEVVIGTVKTLAPAYGIDVLIRAFALARTRSPLLTKLLIAGTGPDLQRLKKLATDLQVDDVVEFLGKVPHSEVPNVLRRLSIYCALSDSESFGVAAIEASACQLPVIVSDADGLAEVVNNGVTGLVVPKRDPEAAALAIERLVLDETLRKEMGQAGRQRVETFYNWHRNVDQMVGIYQRILQRQ